MSPLKKLFLFLCALLLARIVGYADKPELVVQTGHTNAINSIAFSRDGKLLASGSHDTTIKLWDVSTGLQLRTLTGHSSVVTSLAFTQDSKILVSGSQDGTVRLWDVDTGDTVRLLSHAASVISIDISPDGKNVASGGWDNKVKVWDVATGELVRTLSGHLGHVNTVAFSPDGKLLASGSDDYSIKIWDVGSGREIRTLALKSPVNRPQLITDVNTGQPMKLTGIPIDSVNSVCFSPDGKKLASVSFSVRNFNVNGVDFSIKLWDVTTGKEIRTFETFAGGGPTDQFILGNRWDQNALAGSVSFSKDGTMLVGRGADYNVKFWDVATGASLKKFPVLISGNDDPALAWRYVKEIEKMTWQFNPHLPVFSPDGKSLVVVVENNIMLLDVATGESIRGFGRHGSSIPAVAFDPHSNTLVSASEALPTRLWDLSTGKVLWAVNSPGSPYGAFAVAFSTRQRLLATASNNVYGTMGTVDLWDASTGKRLSAFTGKSGGSFSIAFSPDGQTLAAGRLDDAVTLWDVSTGKKIRELEKTAHLNNYVAWSPDGRTLAHAVAGKASSIRIENDLPSSLADVRNTMHMMDSSSFVTLWDVESGREILKIAENRQSFYSIAFSPDGRTLAGGSENEVYLWDARTGRRLFELKAEKDVFESVAFSPDGKTLAAGGAQGIIHLWDVANGREVALLKGHSAAVRSIAFNVSGSVLASGSDDGTIRLWDAGDGKGLCTLAPVDENNYLSATPDNYYTASKAGLEGVAFRLGNRAFPYEQFDLRLNRPDILLRRLGAQDPRLINAYYAAYLKRLEKMRFTEAMLNDDFHLPELSITSPRPPLATGNSALSFSIKAVDDKYVLDRVNVWVNNVPSVGLMNGREFAGSQGYSLLGDKAHTFEGNITLPLSVGVNKVQVSVLNSAGAESLRQTFSVTYAPPVPAPKPELYVVAVGVAKYRQNRYDLEFADKDATDLADFFGGAGKGRFGNVHVLLLTDEKALKENILSHAHELLKGTKVDDEVIVFLAGHGVLDDRLNYYFGTYDMDFDNPEKQGLSYNAVDEMLDGVTARKKLLLIDTCHAGEVDKAETATLIERRGLAPGVEAVAARARPGRSYVGLDNSFLLMQELFADLRRGSGAEVIAAAGGVQYAYEGGGNGLFTHAVLEGLRDNKADRDEDGKVSVSELRDWVFKQVSLLSGGRQTPTARGGNTEFDWGIE